MHPYLVAKGLLDREFPDWNDLGGFNCRPVRGSTRWSDHAYLTPRPHALDIGVPDLSAPLNERLVWGDAVLHRLNELGYARLGIRSVIWRDGGVHEGHHLHVSFLPSQRNKLPACRGGAPDLPAVDIEPLDEEDTMTLRRGMRDSPAVAWLQNALRFLVGDVDTDGHYGPITAAAVAEVKRRLNAASDRDRRPGYSFPDLGDDGDVVDGFLWSKIMYLAEHRLVLP